MWDISTYFVIAGIQRDTATVYASIILFLSIFLSVYQVLPNTMFTLAANPILSCFDIVLTSFFTSFLGHFTVF